MVSLLRVVTVSLALLGAAFGDAFVQEVSFPELTDPLREGKAETYADLVRLVVPDIVVAEGGFSRGQAIDVRHIYWGEHGTREPAFSEAPRVSAVPVRSGSLDRLALLLDFGEAVDSAEGFAVLALFDLADEPRLLDAANVAFDRHTFFRNPVRLSVGAATIC